MVDVWRSILLLPLVARCLLLFAMIRPVVKSFKVPVVEVAELTNPTGLCHRSSGVKPVGCAVASE